MLIAKVTGSVVSTHKNDHLVGHKLLIVQPLDLRGIPDGSDIIALDKVDAGVGDSVLLMREGGSARITLEDEKIPVQAVVVGVIDHVDFLEN